MSNAYKDWRRDQEIEDNPQRCIGAPACAQEFCRRYFVRPRCEVLKRERQWEWCGTVDHKVRTISTKGGK